MPVRHRVRPGAVLRGGIGRLGLMGLGYSVAAPFLASGQEQGFSGGTLAAERHGSGAVRGTSPGQTGLRVGPGGGGPGPAPGSPSLRGDPLRLTEIGVRGGDPRRGGIPVRPEIRDPQARGFADVIGEIPFPDLTPGGPGSGFAAGMGMLGQAQARVAQAIGALEGQFEARKNELREEYQFAETPEERASIQHVLAMIETQRDAGTKVIERVYTQAIADSQTQAKETRALGREAGERTAETFRDAAERSEAAMQRLRSDFGGPMGAGGEALPDTIVGDIGDFEKRAAIEQAFDERMFGVTADDIGFLGAAMRPEMGAQVGGLQRIAAETGGMANIAHQQQVNQRIAAERMQFANALQNLMQTFDQRRFGLEDQDIGLMAQAAQMQASGGGGGGLSPAQEMQRELYMMQVQDAMQREQARFAGEQQNANLLRVQSALSQVGANPLAAILGLAPDAASRALGLDTDPRIDAIG